jgi:hypothetical protein
MNDTELGDGTAADSEEALDPAAALAMVRNQQLSVTNDMGRFVSSITASWGIAWLLGFLALWSIDGLRPGFSLPLPLAVGIFIVLTLAAIGVSIFQGVRSGRGIRGSTGAFTGTVYGVTWSVAMIAVTVLGAGLEHNGMSAGLANIFYPSAYVLVAGLLYVVAGAIWHAVPSIVIGGWLAAVAVAAPFFGYPGNFLFFAIAGGGAFLALAVWGTVRSRGIRRTAGLGGANRG